MLLKDSKPAKSNKHSKTVQQTQMQTQMPVLNKLGAKLPARTNNRNNRHSSSKETPERLQADKAKPNPPPVLRIPRLRIHRRKIKLVQLI